MALTKQAIETYTKIFGKEPTASPTDPELLEILQNEIFDEVFSTGVIDIKTRELLTVVTLSCLQTLPQLQAHINGAINVGNTPLEVREAIYQCAPYIGYPRTLNAVGVLNNVLKDRGVELPLENAGTVEYDKREEEGAKIQVPRYGDEVKAVFSALPGEFSTFVPHLLTAVGFGDFATRSVLTDAQKELIDLIGLVAIGAATQVKPHIAGAIKAGNTLEEVTASIVQIIPYVGFPAGLSALMQILAYQKGENSEAYR